MALARFRTGRGKLPAVFVGDGEFLTCMAATGAKDAAAVGGSHAGAEAVLVHALATGRLKCSFHDICFLYFRVIGTAKVVIPAETTKFF